MISFVIVTVESFLPITRAALIARGYSLSIVAVMRCSSMWSMAGMMVVMLGVPQEKKSVVSLNI